MEPLRPFFLTAALTLAALSAFAQREGYRKPNILVIMADDLGYGDVSFHGSGEVRTPHIDSLCRSGMRLDRFYANSPVCAPTRASLMTGRYPDRVGVPGLIRYHPEDNWGFLDPRTVLLPQRLRAAGYHTALVGKWNLGLEHPNLPNDRGFDLFHGWLEDMMDDYNSHLRHGLNFMRTNRQPVQPEGHATDVFTDWAIGHIGRMASARKPFFLFLSYNAPHFPVQPPAGHLEAVMRRLPGIGRKRASLLALIEHLDDGIGRVVQALRSTGQLDNTLILFTSDNGGNLADSADNRPLRDGKQSMYEGGLRVPTFVTWKGQVPAGSSSDHALATMDILPTLLEAAGMKPAEGIDGVSFLPLIRGASRPGSPRTLYFVRREGGPRYGGNAYHALIDGPWKLLRNSPGSPMELYNLAEDPQERVDRIGDSPEVFRRLNALLMRHIQEGGKVPWQRPGTP